MGVKWNRGRVAGWAAAVVLSVFIPVAIDQGYVRYNAWILPSLGMGAAMLYVVLIFTSSSVAIRLRSFRERFGRTRTVAYYSIIGGLVMFMLAMIGGGGWWVFHKSQEHVAELRKKDGVPLTASAPAPKPPGAGTPSPTIPSVSASPEPAKPSRQSSTGAQASREIAQPRAAARKPTMTGKPEIEGRGKGTAPAIVTVQPGAVVSFGQQGGITAGQVNMNTPKPERVLLPAVQDAMYVELTKDPGAVRISAFVGDVEAYRLAKQFRAVFEKAGWTVEDNAIRSFVTSGEPWTGIRVELPSAGHTGETVNISGSRWLGFTVLEQTLRYLKWEYSANVIAGLSDGPPTILVGPRGN